jgi:hypothetical protein
MTALSIPPYKYSPQFEFLMKSHSKFLDVLRVPTCSGRFPRRAFSPQHLAWRLQVVLQVSPFSEAQGFPFLHYIKYIVVAGLKSVCQSLVGFNQTNIAPATCF